MATQSLKILIAAFACNPDSGSEEGVGWGWVKALSASHQVWVITAEFHRAAIETAVRRAPHFYSTLSFHYVRPKPWHYAPTATWRFIERSVFKPVMNYAYRLWQKDAFPVAKALHREINFDIVHQLTYVGFRFPGQLWKLDMPFVWGPIGGLENTPWRFLPQMGWRGWLYYAGRNIINTFDKKYLPGPRKAFRKADGGIIAATGGIRREIKRWYGIESRVICEIGPPAEKAACHSIRRPGEVLRLSWSGEHLPGKALPLLLHALSQLPPTVRWQLEILGTGPCTNKWKQLARKIDVSHGCRWSGRRPRADAVQRVHLSHIFIITSLKDLTSTVLVEALAQGVPVICPDHCGFSDMVMDDCGIKIPIKTPLQFITDLADTIAQLAKDEIHRRQLAAGALKRMTNFTWEQKAEQVDRIYRYMITRQIEPLA